MFELILTLTYVAGVYIFDSFWFTVSAGVVLLILILPGIYAMLFGAPFLRSSDKRIGAILKLGEFGKNDRVVDLGCGDGKILSLVADSGASVKGYEFSVPTFLLARLRLGKHVRFANFWKQDLSDFNVVICFLLDRTMQDFEERIWPDLKRGVRVISNEFRMRSVVPVAKEGRVYLYLKK